MRTQEENNGTNGSRASQAIHFVICALSLIAIAAFLIVAIIRAGYPYELEWLEGTMVDSVAWIRSGHAPYPPPSVRFIPTVYNPIYFWVSALLASAVGDGFLPLRIVSIASTIGIIVLLCWRLSRQSRSAGWVAAGLYAASFRFAGAWMDTAKSDSLFLFVLLTGFVLTRDARSTLGDVLGASAFAMAFFIKQTALPIVLIVIVAQMAFYRPRLWVQWLTFGVIVGLGFMLLTVTSDGWYAFYTFDNARHFSRANDPTYFWRAAIRSLLPAGALGAGYVAMALSGRLQTSRLSGGVADPRAESTRETWSNATFAMATAVSTWEVFRHRGTYDNTFLPLCLGLSMLAGLAYEHCRRALEERRPGAARFLLGSVILVVLQFGLFAYDPVAQLPTPADRRAGHTLMARLRGLPGRVLVWDHGYYSALAGKGASLQGFIYGDAAGWFSDPPRTPSYGRRRERVVKVFEAALTRQAFDWVVADAPGDFWAPYYVEVDRVFTDPDVFYPVTGRASRPEIIMMRNPIATGGDLPLTDETSNAFFTSGWSAPDSSGRWIVGARGEVMMTLQRSHGYGLELDVAVPCDRPLDVTRATVRWNHVVVSEDAVRACGAQRWTSRLGAAAILDGPNVLQIDLIGAIEGRRAAHVGRIRVAASD